MGEFDNEGFFKGATGGADDGDQVLVSDGPESEGEVEETPAESEAEVVDPILGKTEVDDEPIDDDLFKPASEDGDEEHRSPAAEKRIDQLVAQREQAKEKLAAAKLENATLEGKFSMLQDTADLVAKHYGSFENKDEAMAFDAGYMQTFEKLSQVNAVVAQAAKLITEDMKENDQMPTRTPSAAEAEKVPAKTDPAYNLLAEREARRIIDAALPENVRGAFKAVLTDHILGSHSAEEILAGGEQGILTDARDFAKAKGFGQDDIYQGKAAPTREDAPPTTQSKSPTPKRIDAKEAAEQKEDDRPKSLSEWNRAREARMDSFFEGR